MAEEKTKPDEEALKNLGFQEGIFSGSNKHAHYLTITLKKNVDHQAVKEICSKIPTVFVEQTLKKVSYEDTKLDAVLGLSQNMCQEWLKRVPKGFLEYKHLKGPLGDFPATGGDLFIHIKSNYQDVAFLLAKTVIDSLREYILDFIETQGFVYLVGKNGLGRDLTGFEDGTENPASFVDKVDAALITSGVDKGGSFILAQKWIHNVSEFEKLSIKEQEDVVGRLKPDSGKMKPRPDWSHVTLTDVKKMKIFRQSLPHGNLTENGLFFISYASDCKKYDVMLQNMVNAKEGLMRYTKCVTGNYLDRKSVV